ARSPTNSSELFLVAAIMFGSEHAAAETTGGLTESTSGGAQLSLGGSSTAGAGSGPRKAERDAAEFAGGFVGVETESAATLATLGLPETAGSFCRVAIHSCTCAPLGSRGKASNAAIAFSRSSKPASASPKSSSTGAAPSFPDFNAFSEYSRAFSKLLSCRYELASIQSAFHAVASNSTACPRS